jgi:protein-L-isoaspartate O-methyltransferase
MYSKFQLSVKWFRYFIHASNSRGHGIHSPFVYELIREVLNDDRNYYAYGKIESVRAALLRDQRMLPVDDFGAGSAVSGSGENKVSDIAARSLSTKKFGRLLFRLADFYRARQIIELGSSLGISAAYLASADRESLVNTLEVSPSIAGIAFETFEKLGLNPFGLRQENLRTGLGKS